MDLLNIDDFDLDSMNQISELAYEEKDDLAKLDEIAIIGIAGKIGKAENVQEFWKYLKDGEDFYQQLSEERKQDADSFSKLHNEIGNVDDHYIEGTLLSNISNFDHDFFGLSMQEAKCMDPNQRLLLENTWKALEDAGYAGNKIQGTQTGVFVGYSSDFGMNYRNLIHKVDSEISELAVSGNVASMIASRLSYQFDLGGPAVMVDTACSSGLMAVYEACQAIQKNECDMAIAGSVKCNVYPVWYQNGNHAGVRIIQDTQSDNHVTNTYDEDASGTFLAEGVVSFILKPLKQAERDKDHIYAVIVGGNRNQDGKSNGITAPNIQAQKDLILKAWKQTGINPEKLCYIENHGTATKLGDPIEIRAITEAFRNYTDKKQICAVGSLKTNIGHMDHASGAAGLLKMVLSLEKGEIPKSIHFRQPNHNISFIDSPVYVADQELILENKEEALVGINSFGISGTNCHLILRGYGTSADTAKRVDENLEYLVPISAKSKEALYLLAEKYAEYLETEPSNMQDFAYTIITGRKHFDHRLFLVVKSKEQCVSYLKMFLNGNDRYESENGCFLYGKHKIVANKSSGESNQNEVTLQEIEELSGKQLGYGLLLQNGVGIKTWVEAYVSGADIPWDTYVRKLSGKTISLDTYPFKPVKCWVEKKAAKLPVTKQLIRTMNMDIQIEQCDCEKNWELKEHTLNGHCIFPGTVLVDKMISYICEIQEGQTPFSLKKVQFETPFGMEEQEQKELQMVVERGDAVHTICFSSCQYGTNWTVHATGEFDPNVWENPSHSPKLMEWKSRIVTPIEHKKKADADRGIQVSDRWSKSLRKCWATEDRGEFLFELELLDQYKKEVQQYAMHPALFDIAVNAVSGCIGEENTYLPFSYEKIVFYKSLPAHIFVNAVKKNGKKGSEIYTFDLTIVDEDGDVVAEITHYSIKKLPKEDFQFKKKQAMLMASYRKFGELTNKDSVLIEGRILYCGRKQDTLWRQLEQNPKVSLTYVKGDSGEIKEQLKELQNAQFALAIFHGAEENSDDTESLAYKCVAFLNAITMNKIKLQGGIASVSYRGAKITKTDGQVLPQQAALLGAAGVIGKENESLKISCFDVDEINADIILQQALYRYEKDVVYIRGSQLFERSLEKIEEKEMTVDNAFEGVIIVSGGMGELGSRMCNKLIEKGYQKVLAVGHGSRNRDTSIALDQSVEKFFADVDDREQVESLCEYARKKYGKILGVIHMAGKPGDGFALSKSKKAFHEVYAGKALGGSNLYEVTKDDDLHFMILFSSVASIARDPGQSDYTAANMYLDALAERANIEGRKCVSVLWPPYEQAGMAQYMNALEKNENFNAIGVEEAFVILEKIINGSFQEASVILPDKIVAKQKNVRSSNTQIDNVDDSVVILGNEKDDQIIRNIAKIWSRTLEIHEVDVNDEFIALGGNSLLSTIMLKEYQKVYPDQMEIADLFSYTTINEQAEYLRKKMNVKEPEEELAESYEFEYVEAQSEEDKVTDLLDALMNGTMSVEESLRLLE